MANRIRGNVYIIDSSGIALDQIDMRISSICLFGNDTSARLILTHQATTTDSIIQLANPSHNPLMVGVSFGGNGWDNDQQLRVQSLVAGTGYIYFTP